MPIILLVSTSSKSQIEDLDNSIQNSMSDTISQVDNLDLGDAKSELAEGIDGLVHISDLSWSARFEHPSDLYDKGIDVEAVVLKRPLIF